MEKKNTILLTIIAIATLLVTIIGATFAYFASNIQNNGNVGVDVSTSNKQASFIATADGGINLNVNSYMMQQADAGDGNNTLSNVGEIANNLVSTANLNVSLNASDQGKVTECKYDIVWVWDDSSSDFNGAQTAASSKVNGQNIYPSKYYVRTENGSSDKYTLGFKEFTISGSESVSGAKENRPTSGDFLTEKNLDEIACVNGSNGDCKKLLLKQGETLATDGSATVQYQFTVKFYNLPTDQSSLMSKTFKAHIAVENVSC